MWRKLFFTRLAKKKPFSNKKLKNAFYETSAAVLLIESEVNLTCATVLNSSKFLKVCDEAFHSFYESQF